MDFASALARLLCDGPLRDTFARDPAGTIRPFNLAPADAAALQQLTAEDLEYQARVLLRKRFRILESLLPLTLGQLGETAWPQFAAQARDYWPESPLHDADRFSQWLAQQPAATGSDRERNRIRFLLAKGRLFLGLLRRPWQLQCLVRTRHGWREWLIHF